jgi:hypothetical protein
LKVVCLATANRGFSSAIEGWEEYARRGETQPCLFNQSALKKVSRSSMTPRS